MCGGWIVRLKDGRMNVLLSVEISQGRAHEPRCRLFFLICELSKVLTYRFETNRGRTRNWIPSEETNLEHSFGMRKV